MKSKTETNELKKNSKVITYGLIIALVMLGLFAYSPRNKSTTKEEIVLQNTSSQVVEAKPDAEVENVVARIDLSTKPYTEEANFEIYIDGSETPENEAGWMPKHNARGYTLQKEGTEIKFAIKVLNDVDITMSLRGKWELKNPKNKEEGLKENWVDFTSVTVNSEEILPKTIAVWHDSPFAYTINAKAGETYNIHAEWQKPDAIPEE